MSHPDPVLVSVFILNEIDRYIDMCMDEQDPVHKWLLVGKKENDSYTTYCTETSKCQIHFVLALRR